MNKKKNNKLNIKNPNGYRNYSIIEEIEAGISLAGSEVKSIREGSAAIKDSYANIKNGEAFLYNMYIKPYEHGSAFNVDSTRTRKLLMHKREISKLEMKIKKESLSLIPLKIYFKNNKVKVLLGLGKGKKLYDKREDIKQRDNKRKLDRIKNRYV